MRAIWKVRHYLLTTGDLNEDDVQEMNRRLELKEVRRQMQAMPPTPFMPGYPMPGYPGNGAGAGGYQGGGVWRGNAGGHDMSMHGLGGADASNIIRQQLLAFRQQNAGSTTAAAAQLLIHRQQQVC